MHAKQKVRILIIESKSIPNLYYARRDVGVNNMTTDKT